MKTLVTGGAGFIGSHLVDHLLADGHEVRVIDDLQTGRLENLAAARLYPGFEFVPADITVAKHINDVFHGVDWVFHLAGRADIVPSIDDPQLYFKVNVEGTFNVLQAAKAAGVQRFVYAASSSSYGIPEQYPTPETSPIQPQYPYALTKYMGEELVMHWSQLYQLPAISLRLFNVYGPRSRTTGAYGAVFGVFLAQKLAGKPYTVVGDGQQTRDFTFVTDVVNAFILAAKSEITGAVMNVGSGNHYSINRLVELLGGDVIHIPKRPGEPDCTFADITRITKQLGWQANVGFEAGVEQMLQHMMDWSDAPVWDPASIAQATEKWFTYLANDANREVTQ